ncbi:2-polyprenyl-6-methoxyphenol hydroxylase [Echinicola marina]|uniref:2-polyprenyl-6-methoxyphenol hydroxylase n=1 Tax=Echinicola marina TaxID=2859768 RepID=UPI001CF61057|nr:2-polyprenyl-6-methoxyphenol hydroxylase [Echinicola marina]UCS93008.1 2-polyprenyl-6-methoxyphenol hydroxylase [Echinicola marina]
MKGSKILLIGCLLLGVMACGSESEEDLMPNNPNGGDRCDDNVATLSGEVSTIIENNCAISGCHVAGTGRVDLTVTANIIQNANQIRNYTESGFMPEASSGLTLTQAQKDDIYCWVANGAQNN